MPVQSNATVLAVAQAHAEAGGAVDDWDVQVAAPAPGSPAELALHKWEGSVRAYYRESTERVVGVSGATDIRLKRELILDTADVLTMGLDTDDVLSFEVDAKPGTAFAGRAKVIPTPNLAGVPRAVQTARIRLEDA